MILMVFGFFLVNEKIFVLGVVFKLYVIVFMGSDWLYMMKENIIFLELWFLWIEVVEGML